MSPLPIRKKAWELLEERGFLTKCAGRLCKRASTVRRWFLEPGHKDRRPITDPAIAAALECLFDLQPNDFIWLRGEKAARAAAQKTASRLAAQRARDAEHMRPHHAKADEIMRQRAGGRR